MTVTTKISDAWFNTSGTETIPSDSRFKRTETIINGLRYSVDVPVTPSEDGELDDYQVKITLHTGVGTSAPGEVYLNNHAQNWPYDVRFENTGGDTLSYWRESYDETSQVVWVKLDSIDDFTVLRIRYGDASMADSSDMAGTFMRVISALSLSLPAHEGSGTAIEDWSGNNYDGVQAGALSWVDGKFGKALDYNGVDSFVTPAFNPSLVLGNAVTMMAWIFPRSYANYKGVMGNHVSYKGLILGQYQSGLFNMAYGSGTAYVGNQSASLPALNTWVHTAVTIQGGAGGEIAIYKDGQPNGVDKAVSANISHAPSFFIGRAFVSTGRYFHGIIEEVRVFNAALTAEDIADIYTHRPFEVPTNAESVGKTLVRKTTENEPVVGTPGEEADHRLDGFPCDSVFSREESKDITSSARFKTIGTIAKTSDARFIAESESFIAIPSNARFKASGTKTVLSETRFLRESVYSRTSSARFRTSLELAVLSDAVFLRSPTTTIASDVRFLVSNVVDIASGARFKKASSVSKTSDVRFTLSESFNIASDARYKRLGLTVTKTADGRFKRSGQSTKASDARFKTTVVFSISAGAVFIEPLPFDIEKAVYLRGEVETSSIIGFNEASSTITGEVDTSGLDGELVGPVDLKGEVTTDKLE